MQVIMAWRPNRELIDGELDNRKPGRVTGWMRFFRNGQQPFKAVFDLAGDFHEDIRGKAIRLRNSEPSDGHEDADGTYMDGFARAQRGAVGDITAGIPLGPWTEAIAGKLMAQNEILWDEAGISQAERERSRQEFAERYRRHIAAGDPYFCYSDYPYFEWFGPNGRVVLELDPSQVEIVEGAPVEEKSARDLVEDERRRIAAMGTFLGNVVKGFSRKNRGQGGDGNVSGMSAQ